MSNTISDLIKKTEELHSSNNNWPTVIVSVKETGGHDTGELAITLGVSEKKPLSAIPSEDVFPSTVTVNGEEIKTDVIILPEVKPLAAHECYTDVSAEPLAGARATQRPVLGGTSMGTIPPNGFSGGSKSACTFGSIAYDNEDGTVVGITNNHCMGQIYNPTDTGGNDPYFENDNGIKFYTPDDASLSFSGTTTYTYGNGLPVYQQASADRNTDSKSVLEPLTIGMFKRSKQFTYSTYNQIDTAIFSLSARALPGDDAIFNASESYKQLNLDHSGYLSWATDDEIDSLVEEANITDGKGWPIFRSGRTRGPVGWPGSDPYGSASCTLSCYGLGTTGQAAGGNQGTIPFSDQIFVRGNTDPSDGGDSGSFVCAYLNEGTDDAEWKVIGHLWGGNDESSAPPNGIMVCARITRVASQLNVSAYTGQTTNITPGTKDKKVIQGYQTDDTLVIDGKTYYASGITSEDPNYTP